MRREAEKDSSGEKRNCFALLVLPARGGLLTTTNYVCCRCSKVKMCPFMKRTFGTNSRALEESSFLSPPPPPAACQGEGGGEETSFGSDCRLREREGAMAELTRTRLRRRRRLLSAIVQRGAHLSDGRAAGRRIKGRYIPLRFCWLPSPVQELLCLF